MRKLLILLLAGYCHCIFAQTNVSGIIDTNTNWTLAGSPYIVVGNVLIDTNKTLTIEAGVTVKFNSQRTIQNKGTFIARGTALNKIIFTSNLPNPAPGDWTMLEFLPGTTPPAYHPNGTYASGSIIQHAVIEYGGYATSFNFLLEGSVMLDGASLYLDHIEVRHSLSSAIYLKNNGGSAKIHSSQIHSSRYGIRGNNYTGNVEIDRCTFYDVFGARTISLGGPSCKVTNNFFTNCQTDYLIHVSCRDASIKHNTIYNNEAGGIYLLSRGVGTVSCNKIINHMGSSYETGIMMLEGDSITNNIIVGGHGGITIENFASNPLIKNNQIINTQVTTSSTINGPSTLFIERDASAASDIRFIDNLLFNNNTANNFGLIQISKETWSSWAAPLTLSGNNFIDTIEPHYVRNKKWYADITAPNNWWGTSSTTGIDSLIYDWYEDASVTFVNYTPALTQPNVNAPISPPLHVTKTAIPGGVQLSWDANIEADAAGYKVYWGSPTGYSFNQVVDVGNVTTYQLMGATIADTIGVTCYDNAAVNAPKDQCNGHESWFSFAENPCTTVFGTDQVTACVSYTWIDGNTYATSNNTATYTLAGASGNGCDSIVTLDLVINPLPDVSINADANSLSAVQAGADYQWLDCVGGHIEIPGETDQSYYPTDNTWYAVEVTSNGCVDTSACINFVMTGSFDIHNAAPKLQVYPNPTSGLVFIDLGATLDATVKVYSVFGQLIYEKELIQQQAWQFELEANAGVYFVEVSYQDKKKQHRLILQ